MKYAIQQSIFQSDDRVAIAPYAQVTITDAATGAASDLWSDVNGVTPLDSNIVIADETGFFRVYASAGRYNLAILAGGLTRSINDVVVGSSATTVNTFAEINVAGMVNCELFVVRTDETNDGQRTAYFYDGANLNWLPMVEA